MGDAKLRAEVNAILRLRDNTIAGGESVSIASSQAGPLCFRTGFADINKTTPVQEKHLFGVGSITKVFVAVVIFQLVEEGKLTLQDTVQKHLPADIYRGIDDAENASIYQLLNHTSGIDSWEDDASWLVDARGSRIGMHRIWQKTETLDYVRRTKQTAPSPGTWSYANTNYTLLGLIVESIDHVLFGCWLLNCMEINNLKLEHSGPLFV
ncbi:hypothetical protein CERZMDRAFT_31780 [Cercospora zeae-maydis SCOH1-5]|uniref:Beta-lactamase-related domain-containing protein n=1 Tax=Cercospora zeae-maydis SCOH1-5 TaxID=717836 RepID=A0A6A6FVH9_9PEZI|nr:hypothetical protein CERZMDRAFT_31780 [Cercospora zeae-maydis SCOH1-5]